MTKITTHTPAEFEQQFADEGDSVPSVRALHALMRSVGGDDGIELLPPERPAWAKEDNLVKDGCDMILFAYAFLTFLKCPVDVADLVIALMGISRGETKEWLTITDDMIAEYTGLHRQTISKKRRELIAWEQKHDYTIIQIQEREFDRVSGKYKPTLYRVIITDFVAEFVRIARQQFGWMRHTGKLVDKTLMAGLEQSALTVAENIPNAEIIRRKKAEQPNGNGHKPKTLTAQSNDLTDDLVARFDRWCVEQRRLKFDLIERRVSLWLRLKEVLDRHLAEENQQKPQ